MMTGKKEFMKEGHSVPNVAYGPKEDRKNKAIAIKAETLKAEKCFDNLENLTSEPCPINNSVEKPLKKGFKEIIKESESIPFIPLKKPIEFIPVVFKGKYFEYKITKEGLKINSGIQDIIIQDCIEEQQEALKLWEKYKEVI
jgi:hypothetical protein